MRTLIVDDEAPARAKVRRLLASFPEIVIVGEAASGTEAVLAIRAHAPDLVFLDIQMPELDGFGVIEEIGVEAMPRIIFVTAFDEHALRAFEVHAFDYLLKPVDPVRFQRAVEHARTQLAHDDTGALAARLARLVGGPPGTPRYLKRVLVHHEERAFFLPVDRIDRIEAARNYVQLHAAGTRYTLRGSLGALHDRLDPARFLRIGRSDIVRLDAVKELEPWFHGDYRVVMHDGTRLMWSRRYRAASESDFGVVE